MRDPILPAAAAGFPAAGLSATDAGLGAVTTKVTATPAVTMIGWMVAIAGCNASPGLGSTVDRAWDLWKRQVEMP